MMRIKGYVLVAGLIILFLASLLSFSVWNTARLSFKASVNYQEKMLAKEAAYLALRKAQEKLQESLKQSNCFDGLFSFHSRGFYATTPLPENGWRLFPRHQGLEVPYREAAWNDQNSQAVGETLPLGHQKLSRFFIAYLGGKNTELFYFQVVAIGWSQSGESNQILSAFYQFRKGVDGVLKGERRGLYVF